MIITRFAALDYLYSSMEKGKRIFISDEEKRQRAINRTPTERFDLLMRLIRIGKMLDEARKSGLKGNDGG